MELLYLGQMVDVRAGRVDDKSKRNGWNDCFIKSKETVKAKACESRFDSRQYKDKFINLGQKDTFHAGPQKDSFIA